MCLYIITVENGLETRHFSEKFSNIDLPTSMLHRKVKNHLQIKIINCGSSLRTQIRLSQKGEDQDLDPELSMVRSNNNKTKNTGKYAKKMRPDRK
jgi:hypothetical protein